MPRLRMTKYFGPFRFDPIHLALWRGTQKVHLTGKAAAILHCLLNDAGEWVSKSTILERVWPGTHVHPDNVKVLVRELRVALDDDAARPRYIASEPRHGYAFVAEVSLTTVDSGAARIPPAVPFFLHRAPELYRLVDEFGTALAGVPRFVVITGAEGAGKSALCAMFLRTASALYALKHVTIACGSSDVSRLAAVVDRPVRGVALPDSSLRSGRRIAWAVAQATLGAPLILLLENLDRADDVTLRFLGSLRRLVRGRLMILGTAPTSLASVLTRELGAAPPEIALRPLTQAQVRHYLDIRFGSGRLAPIAVPIARACKGNFGLLVGLMDAFVHHGLVAERTGSDLWQVPCGSADHAALLAALPAMLNRVDPSHSLPRLDRATA